MQHSIEHWITFPWSKLRCAARSAEKFSAAALGESFFFLFFFFLAISGGNDSAYNKHDDIFGQIVCEIELQLSIIRFQKIFPELPSKLIESTSGAKWDLSCKSFGVRNAIIKFLHPPLPPPHSMHPPQRNLHIGNSLPERLIKIGLNFFGPCKTCNKLSNWLNVNLAKMTISHSPKEKDVRVFVVNQISAAVIKSNEAHTIYLFFMCLQLMRTTRQTAVGLRKGSRFVPVQNGTYQKFRNEIFQFYLRKMFKHMCKSN